MTRAECLAMFPNASESLLKLSCDPDPTPAAEGSLTESGRESALHGKIISWCRSQHPIAPYIHSRMDKCSTVGEGVPDFVVCYNSKVVMIECKSRDGKLSEAQRNWKHLAFLNGCVVHIVRSFEDFLEVVK